MDSQSTKVSEPRGEALTPKSLRFSVVIPVRNEEANIRKCLASLCRMDFPRDAFEVIVVDNGSTDRTLEVAESFRDALTLVTLERPGLCISALRNAGASMARGQYFAFLDADCEVPSTWLDRAARSVSEGITGAFGSFYEIPEESSWIARYWCEDREQKDSGETSFLPSGDLFVSRELFQKVQGFNETIQTNEDYEFCQRIRAGGSAITCIPQLAVIHWGTPQSLGGFFRKHRWHGRSVFQVFLRNLPAIHNFKAVALTLYTLLCLLGTVAGVIVAGRTGELRLLWVFLLALLAPALVLGLRAAVSSRRPERALPLTALYLTYAFARVASLFDQRN